jgi:hypothetical protein
MATELAKAYVGIIPSAEGITGNLAKVLEPEAESAVKNPAHLWAAALSAP